MEKSVFANLVFTSLSRHFRALLRPVQPRVPVRSECRCGLANLLVLSAQVESEKQQEHEAKWLQEHLAMLLGVLLDTKHLLGDSSSFLGQSQVGNPGAEVSKAAELLQRCEALERKTATFENIVCVLNREVERVAMTAEACGRQHRLDQDRIEALSNKVSAGAGWQSPHGARDPFGQAPGIMGFQGQGFKGSTLISSTVFAFCFGLLCL